MLSAERGVELEVGWRMMEQKVRGAGQELGGEWLVVEAKWKNDNEGKQNGRKETR